MGRTISGVFLRTLDHKTKIIEMSHELLWHYLTVCQIKKKKTCARSDAQQEFNLKYYIYM